MRSEINKLVDKVYVLTIDRNSDRHQSVNSVLANIEFEFWHGLDAHLNFPGKKYVYQIEDEFFIKNDLDKEYVSRFTIGQLGAYYSIKKMINHIAKYGYDKVLVFEDDMLPLKKNWKYIFRKSLEEAPADWDILLLGYIYDGAVYKFAYNRNLRFLIKAYNTIKSVFINKKVVQNIPFKFSKHLDNAGFSMGGHAFCLSKKGAELMSSFLSPMQSSGDVLISELITEKKIKAYAVYPCLFLQNQKFGSKTKIV